MGEVGDILPGFGDPVRGSQRLFREALEAMARPGTIRTLSDLPVPPAHTDPAAYALLLTLCDAGTPVFLSASLAQEAELLESLHFHTGAPVCADPGTARFALIADPEDSIPLERFSLGTDDYPDASATIILQVQELSSDGPWRLSGPGIRGTCAFGVHGLGPDFTAQRRALHACFPRGVDMFLSCGDRLAALPRTTRIEEA